MGQERWTLAQPRESSSDDRLDVRQNPFTAKSCQSPGTPFSEWTPRSANSIPDPATRSVTVRETSTSPGLAADPDSRPDVDCDAADVVADQLTFSGVEADAHLDPEVAHRVAGRAGASDRPRGSVERGQEAVAHRLHRPSAVALELAAHEPVVLSERVQPAAVSELRGADESSPRCQ